MMRAWIAVALLASSWLLGLGYFNPPNMTAWACTLVAAVILLADTSLRLPSQRQRLAIMVLLVPGVVLMELPSKGMAVLLLVGTAASLVPAPVPWLRRASRGALLAGMILLAQGIVLTFYQIQTARAHELPGLLAEILGALANLLNADAAIDNGWLVVRSASSTVRVSATWELLLAPGTVCFVVGGCVLLAVIGRQQRGGWWTVVRSMLALALLVVVWAPLRAMLLVTIVLQQRVRATPTTFPNVGETLVSTWVHILLLIMLALLAGTLLRRRVAGSADRRTSHSHHRSRAEAWVVFASCALGIGLLTFSCFWAPVGQRQEGRVMVVERHSSWEPTTEPYGTVTYGEAGSYNYGGIYEYSSQYYQMSRLLPDDKINDAALQQCDVLIIKTPTSRYSTDEVGAVVRFVEQGGSLLLIGDHTNVFNMSTYLNDISRHFGFTFRNDLLFQIGDPYRQMYYPPKVRHPILQFMPPMNFAVSCSIDPGSSAGTMVIRNCGLYNLPPAYHESNYHPQAEYRPDMQYGAWCQLWAAVHGKGRVVAFADSTLFSNFCTFQPGKAELFIGMLEWLNHSSVFDAPIIRKSLTWPLVLIGIGLILVGIRFALRQRSPWLLPAAAGIAAWAATSALVVQTHQHTMPLPPKQHSMRHVVIDRTVSDVPLFTGAFADDVEGNGYGMLEQWIPRIGDYTSRRSGADAFQGDGLVLICPTKLPSQTYREQLVRWVESGGRLVVFDSPDVENSTANSILMLFGLTSTPGAPTPDGEDEPVRMSHDSAGTPLSNACLIDGGTPIAQWGSTAVAATAAYGNGEVTAIGFGSLFNDANMGYHWLPEPDEELLQRYELLYALLRAGLTPQG